MLADRCLRSTYIVVAFVAAEMFYGAAVAALADGSYLALVAVIGVIAAVVTFIEPVWGLYLFVAAMFAEGLLVVEAGPTGARLLGILVFGAWIARSLSSGRFQIILPLQGLFAIAYIVWGVMSAAWAIDSQLVFDRAQVLVQSIALYVLVINLVNSPRRVQNILSIIVVASLALAFLTIFRVLSGEMIRGRVDIAQISDYDPNEQAAGFLLSAAVLMALFSRAVQLSRKLLSPIALSIVVLAVLATSSRGAMLSLIAILAFSLILDRKLWQLVLLAPVIGIAALFLLPPTFLNRLESIVTLSDRGAGRVDIWLVGMQIISAHSLLGVGLGNFGRAFDRYLPQTPGIRRFLLPGRGPHNIFLGALGELGVLGLALFAVIIGLTIKSALTAVLNFKRQNEPQMTTLAMGVLLGLLGVLVASLFVDLRYRKYFWLLLALSGVMQRLSSELKGKSLNESARSGP